VYEPNCPKPVMTLIIDDISQYLPLFLSTPFTFGNWIFCVVGFVKNKIKLKACYVHAT